MSFQLIQYTSEYETKWDDFVLNHSVNGTFLQTRNFLNYHPESRFKDASLLIVQENNIVAVVPACIMDDEGKCFYSHKGSTFGGIIIAKEKYNISTLEEIFKLFDMHFVEESFSKIVFKITSNIFSKESSSLLEYYLYKNGYSRYDELSFFIDLMSAPDNLLDIMSASKRRDYRYSLRNSFEFRKLNNDTEIASFYELLCRNLKRHNTNPVHSLAELEDLSKKRLRDSIDFYGVFYNEKLIAGSMVFKFQNEVFHTQYLAQDYEYAELFSMNFLDYKLIEIARDLGFKRFSFGISTENNGLTLNTGLALFKEGLGSEYSINSTFVKKI